MLGLWRRADLFLGRLPAAFAAGTGGATDADARAGDFATIAPGADPTSILAAAELLRVWIEEMDRSQLASEAGAPA
jgi:hypothetical protein